MALVVAAWFATTATLVLLSAFVALTIAIVLNVPVRWLERRGMPRVAGSGLVLLASLALIVALGWLIGPRVLEQLQALVDQGPVLVADLEARTDSVLEAYPALDERVDPDSLGDALPSAGTVLSRVGRASVGLLMAMVFGLVIVGMAIYALVRPRPLVAGLLRATPESRRDDMARAVARSSQMLVGWVWSNIVVGAIEAVLVAIVLSLLDVPGALVWATLAFFAELVPKLGPYLMAIPPVLVALAVDPMDALWIAIFYAVMNELMGDFVTPYVRGETMQLHPFYLLLAVIAFGSVLGLVGALVATPLAAFVAAFVEEFYLSGREGQGEDQRVDDILDRRVAPG